MKRIGIDGGGTNTDAVPVADGRVIHSVRAATTADITSCGVASTKALAGAAAVVGGHQAHAATAFLKEGRRKSMKIRGPSGEVLHAVSIEECLRRAASAIGCDDRKPEPGRGKGIARDRWMTTGGSSGVYVKINPDGSATLASSAVEIGFWPKSLPMTAEQIAREMRARRK